MFSLIAVLTLIAFNADGSDKSVSMRYKVKFETEAACKEAIPQATEQLKAMLPDGVKYSITQTCKADGTSI